MHVNDHVWLTQFIPTQFGNFQRGLSCLKCYLVMLVYQYLQCLFIALIVISSDFFTTSVIQLNNLMYRYLK